MEAHGLAHAPLDAVPHHGFAECAGNSESDVRSHGRRFANAERREEGAGVAGSLVINSTEILRSQEADTFRKTSDGTLPLGADGKFLSAARPAAREHRTPVLGLHAGQKAVRFGTMAIIRLKSTFRHLISSI